MLSLNVTSYFKLNTDRSGINTRLTSVGGLLKDDLGRWVGGFGMNVGSCSITIAELCGLYNGIFLAWNHDVQFMEDSCSVTQLITSQNVFLMPFLH